ncbi:hypothetical protein DL96DRAFT_1686438 [Flagelloscypha sp. PMI_526]|nr:hypothetical protein DL96DRAFT_1686438 [Flagelloscypha sp. PMI_526]
MTEQSPACDDMWKSRTLLTNLVNGGAQYGFDVISNALSVTFQLPSCATSGRVEMNALNSNPSWEFIGLVQGRANTDSTLSSCSYEYVYAAGTKSTAADATPQNVASSYFIGAPRTAESVIWNAAINAGVITFTQTWIQPDGTEFALQMFTQSNALYGGDMAAFGARFPAPVAPITYEFVPI